MGRKLLRGVAQLVANGAVVLLAVLVSNMKTGGLGNLFSFTVTAKR